MISFSYFCKLVICKSVKVIDVPVIPFKIGTLRETVCYKKIKTINDYRDQLFDSPAYNYQGPVVQN